MNNRERNTLWVEHLRRKLAHPGRAWKGGGGMGGVLKELRDRGEDVEGMDTLFDQLIYGGPDPRLIDDAARDTYLRHTSDALDRLRSRIDAKIDEIASRP